MKLFGTQILSMISTEYVNNLPTVSKVRNE